MREAGTWDESAQTVTDTICPYCGVGCTLSLHVQDNRIVKVLSPLDSDVTQRQPVREGPLRVRLRPGAPEGLTAGVGWPRPLTAGCATLTVHARTVGRRPVLAGHRSLRQTGLRP